MVMKMRRVILCTVLTALLALPNWVPATAQTIENNEEVNLAERNLGGPRLGLTYVMGTKSKLANALKEKGVGTVISQFGWHFEYMVVPEGIGPSFVVQFVPLVAAVEYGTLIPSGSLALGVRFPGGIEFGLGPNVIVAGDKGLATALVVAVGKSFNYGGVSIPIDVVWTTNPDGNRFSVIFGYAIMKSSH